jgi:hypothetical protein
MEKNTSRCLTQKAPYKGLCAESEEKHEPASDIEHCLVDGLKALDPNRPIREADMCSAPPNVCYGPKADMPHLFDNLVNAVDHIIKILRL